MRYSLRAHVHDTAPDVLYGYAGQLWVDCSDDFGVWQLGLWTSEPPRERFGGYLVLGLVKGTSRKVVVRLSGCDLEHFWRERGVWIGNKVCREGDWRTPTAERL